MVVEKIDTPTLKKLINSPVKYKVKGSNLWSYDIVREVVKKNIIFDKDARSFSNISEMVVVPNT